MRRHRQGPPDYSSIDGIASRGATRRRRAALIALAVAMFLALSATSAQAAPGYKHTGEFGSELPYFGIYSPGPRVAIDDVTDDVLVAPVEPGSPGVFVYSSNGTLLDRIASGSVNAGGIAIDQTNGDLYLADTNSGRIIRYTTDRANPPTYTVDSSYNGASQGSDFGAGQIGSLLSALAIDPTTGDLLVADSGGLRIDRYAPDGSLLGSFNGEGTAAGRFSSLIDMAVNASGEIYVVQNGEIVREAEVFFRGDVQGSIVTRFTPDGSAGSVVAAGGPFVEARAVGIDPATGQIVVATGGGGAAKASLLTLWRLTGGGSFESSLTLAEPAANGVTAGIAIDPTSGRLYLATGASFYGGGNSVQTLDPQAAPGASLDVPNDLTPFSALLEGVVTPVNRATQYHYEYSANGGSSWSSTVTAELAAGEDPVPVPESLSTEPVQSYLVRLVAEDGEAKNVSPFVRFVTPAAPPVVETRPAVEIEPTRAHLGGTVNPLGSQATYNFEYGTSAGYGSRVPAAPAVAGNGRRPLAVGIEISGLVPGTTYHYRIVAVGPGGQSSGEDATFTTPAGAPRQRAFELVSPLNKGNVPVDRARYTAVASPDGNTMLFGSEKSSYPGAEATPLVPRVLATRSEAGWSDFTTDPPQYNLVSSQNAFVGTFAVSDDGSRALVVSKAALAPGAVEGQPNLYIRHVATSSFTLIATGEVGPGGEAFGTGAEYTYVGGSSDLTTVVFIGGPDLLPSAVASQNMYKWTEGVGLQLVSIKPDGSPFASDTNQIVPSAKDPAQVSADGNRVYFEQKLNNGEVALYLREGQQTTLVSASHRPGDPEMPPGAFATFNRASADGRDVVFTMTSSGSSDPPPLTPDAPAGQHIQVYRYDAVTGSLTYLASEALVMVAFPESSDMYYRPNGQVGHEPIYYLSDGVSKVVATEDGPESSYVQQRATSPSGRYFGFLSRSKLTSFENEGVEELYLYDAQTEELTCPSCRTDGEAPTGPAKIGQTETSQPTGQRHAPRAVLDDGTVFFDTPEPLVPSDSNGERDVYEYKDGTTRLLSRGSQSGESQFADADANGDNVFIITSQRLVPQDDDDIVDLYDARVGGGFATADSGGGGCAGAACGATGASLGSVSLGSESVGGTAKRPDSKQRKHGSRKRCEKQHHEGGKEKKPTRCRKQKKRAGSHGKGTGRTHNGARKGEGR